VIAQEIIEHLRRFGGSLMRDGNDLIVDAPDSILTPELIRRIRQHKPALLAALPNPCRVFRSSAASRKLFADLLAAGCNVYWDGDELRVGNLTKIPMELWTRLESADSDFLRAARE